MTKLLNSYDHCRDQQWSPRGVSEAITDAKGRINCTTTQIKKEYAYEPPPDIMQYLFIAILYSTI